MKDILVDLAAGGAKPILAEVRSGLMRSMGGAS